MKNKASLALLEQLVMILVFSLAAALCLRIFAWSDRTSREMELRDRAVVLCQNAAETIKAEASLGAGAERLGADKLGNHWVRMYGEDLRLRLEERKTGIPGFGSAEICVVSVKTEEILFSITVGWQEVAP